MSLVVGSPLRRTAFVLVETALLFLVLAASLAMQSRPEMIVFPAVVIGFLVGVRPQGWRVLFAWPTAVAGVMWAILLVPHALDVVHALSEPRSPAARSPRPSRRRSAW